MVERTSWTGGRGRRGEWPARSRRQAMTRRGWLGVTPGGAAVACSPAGGDGSAGGGAPRAAAQGKVLFWMESASDQARQLWTTLQAEFKAAQPALELEFDTTPVPQGQS